MAGHVDISNKETQLEGIDVPNPGAYIPDETQGITRAEDLPEPKVTERSRNYKHRPCPKCGHGAREHYAHISDKFDKAVKRSGLDCTLQDLRRTVGTLLAERGISEKVAAEYLGHASTQTTARFYQAVRQDVIVQTARTLRTGTGE